MIMLIGWLVGVWHDRREKRRLAREQGKATDNRQHAPRSWGAE